MFWPIDGSYGNTVLISIQFKSIMFYFFFRFDNIEKQLLDSTYINWSYLCFNRIDFLIKQ